ncbi:hypothetical protein WA1_33345 [Scytonema hofmannii PCC 7110]|uniref:Uncharacterized protein n=1 Tax=Scytonema hofmannii PCC 7110 TaxID=128403 RepID=A0A139X2L4_9CYAN|nr:hypothetical protein [Scytonema hofmannii]KYC38900.1 hypothetical protein WA1_33345 [Scytonema hofmannii PCC 7110]
MKVIVRDAEIFKNIELKQLTNYLQSTGWYLDRPFLDDATIWLKQEQPRGEFEILLPNSQNLGDYVTRISEAIDILATVENCSQLEIIGEIITNYPNITIQGLVTQITSPNGGTISGDITLFSVIVDKLRPVYIKLANHEYILAIKAYTERLPVLCTGDLVKENNTFILKNPQQFRLDQPHH